MRKSRKNSVKVEDSSFLQNLLLILKSSIVAVIITLLCFVIFALVMKIANLQDSVIRPVIQVVRIFSIVVGGVFAVGAGGTRGWLKGASVGLLYMVWASVINIISGGDFFLDSIFLSDIAMGIVVGAVGGIIGVNIKK